MMVLASKNTGYSSIKGFFALQMDYIWKANGVKLQCKWSTVGVQKDYIFFKK